MNFPDRFSDLPAYAFPRLRALLDHHTPDGDVIHMTIGEPKHAFPPWVMDEILAHADGFNRYPPNEGAPELRTAFADWFSRRYGVTLDPARQAVPLNGTREGLYNIAMALCPETKNSKRATVLMPNPFYQVYMLAAMSVGAEPVFVNATAQSGHLPDYASLPEEVLARASACYICSPANPQGAVADRAYWRALIDLAERYDFRIFADECYSEIYRDTPPPGALQVATEMGADPDRVVVFHSLSKRSNLPGLRSGFVAGGARSMDEVRQLRTYTGAPLPLPLQMAAARAWSDEDHVIENRRLYREKYDLADQVLGDTPGYAAPEAGFFLWLPVSERFADGAEAALALWQASGVRVLPGAYLSQDTADGNPGARYIRVAMVAPKQDVERGLLAIRTHLFDA